VSVVQIAVLVCGGYAVASVVTLVMVRPAMRAAGKADQDAAEVPLPVHAEVEPTYASLALQRVTEHAATLLGASEACLVVRTGESLLVVAQHGLGDQVVAEEPASGHRLALTAASEGRQLASASGRRFPRSEEPGSYLPESAMLATPVAWHGSVGGALSVRVAQAAWNMQPEQLELLSELGSLAGIALDHQRRGEHQGADANAEVEALLEALGRTDPYTSQHAVDVVELAKLVGSELGLDRMSAYELELAAALHDVGKIRIPRELLQAPRALTAAEWELMRMHPVWGFEIVAAVPGLEPVAPLVRAHHERWDGDGYPDRLEGERIPLASRIIAVCDTFGAVTSDRAYRRGASAELALEEINRCSGTQFDPAVVEAFGPALTRTELPVAAAVAA
jgi:HD-GYP domain-containing protein (c-di-GMP phosphodiesterase class II)